MVDYQKNENCDICMSRLDYINCVCCSNKICVECITKLESLIYHYQYITYDCCVCKKNNSLNIKDITDIIDLQNIINDLSNKYLDLQLETQKDEEVYLSIPVVLYYPPVISNNDFTYCGTNIILHKTFTDNNYVCIETLGECSTFSYEYLISRHHQQSEYELQHNENFYYITTLQDIHSRLNITLIDKSDFAELVEHKILRLS